MFVSAPRVNGNGSNSFNVPLVARNGAPKSVSLQAALAAANTMNRFSTGPGGQTIRSFCQNGVISYKKYRKTSYSAFYYSRFSSGRVISINQDGGPFFEWNSYNHGVGLGYVGFHSTGFDDNLHVLDHTGTNGSPQAIYNRAVALNLKNRAVSECRQKAAEVKLDLSEAFAGLPETVLMVALRTKQVLTAWRSMRRGDFRGAAAALGLSPRRWHKTLGIKSTQQAWLELQYGWLPLLGDIWSGIKLTNDLLSGAQHHAYAKRQLETDLWTYGLTSGGPSTWVNPQITTWGRTSVDVRYNFRVSDTNLAFLNSLGVLNPFYTVWVAVPFSFLVDWFLPIGDWLQSISSTLGLQFIDGYITQRSWGYAEVSASSVNLPNKKFEIGSTTASAGLCRITRDALTVWPWPVPYLRFPFSSDKRVANAIALISTSRKHR